MGTGTRYVRICDQCFEAGLMDTISGAVHIQASVVDLDTRILGTGAGVLGIKAGFVRTSARAVRVPVGAMGFKGGIISTDAGTRKHGLWTLRKDSFVPALGTHAPASWALRPES